MLTPVTNPEPGMPSFTLTRVTKSELERQHALLKEDLRQEAMQRLSISPIAHHIMMLPDVSAAELAEIPVPECPVAINIPSTRFAGNFFVLQSSCSQYCFFFCR